MTKCLECGAEYNEQHYRVCPMCANKDWKQWLRAESAKYEKPCSECGRIGTYSHAEHCPKYQAFMTAASDGEDRTPSGDIPYENMPRWCQYCMGNPDTGHKEDCTLPMANTYTQCFCHMCGIAFKTQGYQSRLCPSCEEGTTIYADRGEQPKSCQYMDIDGNLGLFVTDYDIILMQAMHISTEGLKA